MCGDSTWERDVRKLSASRREVKASLVWTVILAYWNSKKVIDISSFNSWSIIR